MFTPGGVLVPLLFTLFGFGLSQDNQPDCLSNKDCSSETLCAEFKCRDPCTLNICGELTICRVKNHIPVCACKTGFSGPLTGGTPNRKGDGNKKFQIQTEKKNWHRAMTHCLAQDMRLATIESQEEHDRVVRQIQNANVKPNGRWWIGGADLGQAGDFLWYATGRRFNYTNFPSGQPDNHIYENGEDEHCLELRTEWGYAWNDYVCHYNQYFVCEYYSK